jgi:hypothetical protein
MKRAVVYQMDDDKLQKLIDAKWRIVGDQIEHADIEDGDTCVLCLDQFGLNEHAFKLKCCFGKYHPKCMKKSISQPENGIRNTATCFHCRRDVYITDREEQFAGLLEQFCTL